MAICWHCREAEYHNYKDIHGIRCPRCGQKEKDDPALAKVVEIRLPVAAKPEPKAPVKRASTRRK